MEERVARGVFDKISCADGAREFAAQQNAQQQLGIHRGSPGLAVAVVQPASED